MEFIDIKIYWHEPNWIEIQQAPKHMDDFAPICCDFRQKLSENDKIYTPKKVIYLIWNWTESPPRSWHWDRSSIVNVVLKSVLCEQKSREAHANTKTVFINSTANI